MPGMVLGRSAPSGLSWVVHEVEDASPMCWRRRSNVDGLKR